MTGQINDLRATLVAVLNDGSGSKPWQGLARRSNGEEVLVTSRAAPLARIGDDLLMRGVYAPNPLDPALPASFACGDPNPPQNRFLAMLTGSASIQHYLSTSRQNSTGLSAWINGLRAGLVEAFTGPDVTTIPARGGDNYLPHFTFAAQLLESVPLKGPIVMLNPASFAPSELVFERSEPVPVDPSTPMSGEATKRGHQVLLHALPESLKGLAGGAFADRVVRGQPGRVELNTGEAAGWRSAKGAIILPYDRYQTGTAFFAATTGLSLADFAPRALVDGRQLQAFEMCRQLGHALAGDYQMKSDGTAVGDNREASFADAFAVLAVTARALKDGTDKPYFGPQLLVDHLRLAALNGDRLTANAAAEALGEALLMSSDRLAQANGHDLLTTAVRLANAYSLDAQTLAELPKLRQRLSLDGRLPSLNGLGDRLAGEAETGATQLLSNALAVAPRMLLPRTALSDPAVRAKVKAQYMADLKTVLGYSDRRDASMRTIATREQTAQEALPATDLVRDRLAVLHDLQFEMPVRPFPIRPAPNWLLTRTYRPRYAHDGLKMAFDAEPAQALIRWQNHLRTEIALREQGATGKSLIETRQARLDNAFALVAKPENVDFVKKVAPGLLSPLLADAKSPLVLNAADADAELGRLRLMRDTIANPGSKPALDPNKAP